MQAIPRRFSRTVRWLLPAVLLVAAPKCLLCLLAYVGVGAALGLGGPEICGAVTGSPDEWTSLLAWSGIPLGLVLGWFALERCFLRHRPRIPWRRHGRSSVSQTPVSKSRPGVEV